MSESADDLIEKGDEAFEKEDYSTACDLFREAVRQDPDNLYAWMSLSASTYSDKRFELALEISEQGLERFPEEAGFAFNAGLASNQLDEHADAVSFYTRAVEINPEYARAYYARGNCYLHWKEYRKAVDDYEAALEHGGEFNDIYCSYGLSLQALGRYADALACYNKALENGERPNPRKNKGICHYLLEGPSSREAFDLLHEYYHTIYSGDREVGVYLATILRDQERYEELEEHLKTKGMVG